ncbi:MAG TPA: CapA family protein [Puia sp.]|nr:CapA family protein [Puia sp.]
MSFRRLLTFSFLLSLGAFGCAPVQKLVQRPGEAVPVPSPTAVLTPTTEAVSNEPITLAFTGDIMMGGSAAHKLKTEGPDSFFTHTAPLLKEADIAMGNLEGPLGVGGEKFPHKKYNFLVDPSAATGLAHAGFKLLTLANNHTMDFGTEALQSTLAALDAQGLQHCGAGMNDAEARKPAWFEVKDHKVAVLAYSLTYPTEYWAQENRPGCAAASGPDMREDIQKARSLGADIVIVCCHWGQEKHTRLRGYQPTLAHLAIDAGADAVVCHHPHIWQQLEVYKGKPIAYAIGKFAFGTVTSISQSGLLYLTFGQRGKWLGGRIVPLDVFNSQVAFDPRPMNKAAAVKFYLYLKKLSKKKADLKLVDGKPLEIDWAAPEDAPEDAPVTAAAPEPAPSPISTPVVILTPTPDPAGNPEGSVPGVKKH